MRQQVEASWAFQVKHGVTPIVELSCVYSDQVFIFAVDSHALLLPDLCQHFWLIARGPPQPMAV